jgi:Acyl-CoA dehydrogenase, C-terminal domain
MIDAHERALMEETVRAAIADAASSGEIDSVLAKLGWLEMLGDEPDAAIAVVFGALGAANAAATALDDVLATALGEKPRAGLAVLLPAFSAWDPPARVDRGDLRGEGLATARAAIAEELLVVTGTAEQPWLAIVPIRVAQLHALRGIDPALGLHSVRVEGRVDATALDPAAWRSAIALGRRAIAHQILGASRSMLQLARSHALERTQFDRPIARFQAVRHRLADALVAIEALEASLAAAREQPGADSAGLAKAVAGRTAHTVAGHCQQVLAGVGFTTEHPFHRFSKRVLALEGLFGSADAIALEVGRRMLADRRVPTMIEL